MRKKDRCDSSIVGKVDEGNNDLGTVGDEDVFEDCNGTECICAALNNRLGIVALKTDAKDATYILLALNCRVALDKEAEKDSYG